MTRAVKRVGVVAAAMLTFGVSTGIALAYLTASGAGAGTLSTDSFDAVIVDVTTAEPTTPLLPGQTGEVTLEVSNPNNYPLNVVSVVASGDIEFMGGTDCNLASAGVSFANQSGLSIPIAANAMRQIVHLADAVSMSSTSVTGCQGVAIAIPVTITARYG
jgi:hypothetical protein